MIVLLELHGIDAIYEKRGLGFCVSQGHLQSGADSATFSRFFTFTMQENRSQYWLLESNPALLPRIMHLTSSANSIPDGAPFHVFHRNMILTLPHHP